MKKIILISLTLLSIVSYNSYAYDASYINTISDRLCKIIAEKNLNPKSVIDALESYKNKKPQYKELIWLILDSAKTTCLKINNRSIEYPTGVYVSAWPTNDRNYSVKENLLAYDHVDGILLRIPWKDIELQKWVYDFSKIDYQLDLAKKYNKHITLSIIVDTPDWFKNTENTFYYTLLDGSQKDMAYPWNEDFLDSYKKLISVLGKKYNDDDTIHLIQVWNASFNGIEMQYYRTIEASDIWYTDEKAISSWTQILSSFNTHFPDKIIANDYHPLLWNDTPSQEIYNYAKEHIGKQYWASMWWWTEPNTHLYSAQDNILTQSLQDSFAGVQFAQAGSKKPEKLSDNGFTWLVDYSLKRGICYFEIWEIDIKNEAYITDFEKIRNTCNTK